MMRGAGLLVAAIALALAGAMGLGMGAGAGAREGRQDEAEAAGVRFVAVDITIDSGEAALGAYQFEYVGSAAGGSVKLVGVEGGEGGEAAPFSGAPHYDPRALSGGRVIVGAFSTAQSLPRGAVRVARLHLAVEGAEEDAGGVEHAITLMTAGDGAGTPIDATVRYQQVEAP